MGSDPQEVPGGADRAARPSRGPSLKLPAWQARRMARGGVPAWCCALWAEPALLALGDFY